MLSEISQKQKEKLRIISIICGILKSQIHKSREKNSGNQGQGGGGNGDIWVRYISLEI